MPHCATLAPPLAAGRPPLHEQTLVACFLHDPDLSPSLPAALNPVALNPGEAGDA
jgi:hypothetical protein